jgi:hypothetical protein
MDEPYGAMVNPAHPPGPTTSKLSFLATRICLALNRSPSRTLTVLIALYLLIAFAQAATKLLWCDELITLAIARQGSLPAIWRALAAGADPNPPLSHWLVLLSTSVFGPGALAVRLPAIACMLLAIVSLWLILRRWTTPFYAAIGILAFMATRGFDYAYDARSYAPLTGFAMAAIALWLVSTTRSGLPRIVALAAMSAALALGISSNYYGVLAFVPIALGEAIRTRTIRRVQPGAWLALAAAALPLLAFRPLIRHNLAEFGPHAWNRPQFAVVTSSYFELVEGVFWPVLGLAFYAGWKQWKRPSNKPATLQPYELAAITVLLLYPILGYLVALLGHGMISPRCVTPVCCAFGIAAALLGHRLFAASPRAAVAMLAIAILWVTARESACAFVLAQQRTAFFALRDQIAAHSANQPILVADSLFVLPLAHYSSEDVRSRIVFPIDFAAIHAFEPDDSGEQNLWAGRNGVFAIRITPYDASLFPADELTLIARPGGWLAHNLTRDGYRLAEPAANPAWQNLGGVFTPLAHQDTRLLTATR